MIKRLVNSALKTVLSELFVDAKDVVKIDLLGHDMFSDSKVNLNNLTVRPDIFNVCLHPLRLIFGHIGSIQIEGIAEALMGGSTIRVQVDKIYLLLAPDVDIDAEEVQIQKKLLIELQSGKLGDIIIKEMMKRIQGLPPEKDPELKKQKDMLIRVLMFALKNVQVQVRNIHLRIEVPSRNLEEAAEKFRRKGKNIEISRYVTKKQ